LFTFPIDGGEKSDFMRFKLELREWLSSPDGEIKSDRHRSRASSCLQRVSFVVGWKTVLPAKPPSTFGPEISRPDIA
jgi:hypothetical protein